MMQLKDNTISCLKGLGIILVVVGHAFSSSSSFGVRFVYSFHMPLFFFASGVLFKSSYFEHPVRFVKKKIKGLYFTFVGYSLLFLVIHNFLVLIDWHTGIYDFYDYITNIWQILLFVNVDTMQSHMWFMRSLFVCYMIFFWLLFTIRFFLKKNSTIEIMSFVLLEIVGLYLSMNNIILPMRLEREFVCAALIALGFYFPRTIWQHLKTQNLVFISCLCILALYFVISSSILKIDIAKSFFISSSYFTISSISGILLMYSISVVLEKYMGGAICLIRYIGNNTLPIYVFHILAFRIVNLLKIIYYNWDYSKLAEIQIIGDNNNLLWILAYTVVGVLVPLLINVVVYRLKNRMFYKEYNK